MRRMLAGLFPATVLAIAGIVASTAPLQSAPFSRGVVSSGDNYQGPCDVVTCDEAYSFARAMTRSYTGNLFLLTRLSDGATLNVGQVNHVVDTSGIPAFCAKTTCVYTLYAQINGNTLTGPQQGPTFNGGLCVPGGTACAPIYFVDPSTGLPITRTIYPSQLYSGDTAAAGITGGTNAVSVYSYGRNEGYSGGAGFFGPAHPFNHAEDIPGSDFLPGNTYNNTGAYSQCSTSTSFCVKIDIEILMSDGADYSPTTKQNLSVMATWDGIAATDTITVYTNSATPIYSHSPPAVAIDVGLINTGHITTLRVGGGGDGYHVDSIFREGLVTNSALTAADYTAIDANARAFYDARSPDVCASTADYGYYWLSSGGLNSVDQSIGSTLVGYALRRMSASYWGPIADLRNAVGTVNTYGPDTTPGSCLIDPAAKVFCDANPPCTVAKLYHQTTYSSQNVGNVPDTKLDAAQATAAAQPEVKWNALNGLPTMVFAGAQTLCTPTLGSNDSYIDVFGVVAKRTSTTTANAVLNIAGAGTHLGFGGANQATGAFTSTVTGSQTDGTFHSLIHEVANGTATLYVDNVSVGSNAAGYPSVGTTAICLGSTNGSNFFTGELAEATAGANGIPGALNAGTDALTLYAKQHSAWGI
jgi:hypothetical protein